MSNKTLFLKAIESTPDAVEKLAAFARRITPKLANLMQIYNRAPTVDPLDNSQLGPARSGQNIDRGRNIGKLVGTGAGAALGGLAGHAMGGGLMSAATHAGDAIGSHLPTYDPNMAEQVHDGFTNAGKYEGTADGLVAGGMLGHWAGGHIGAGLGRASMAYSSPESQAAERIKRMDPASGLAHIRMLEQSGSESPSVIQAMKSTYETRRRGLQTQIQSGVALPPGDRAQDIGTGQRTRLV